MNLPPWLWILIGLAHLAFALYLWRTGRVSLRRPTDKEMYGKDDDEEDDGR